MRSLSPYSKLLTPRVVLGTTILNLQLVAEKVSSCVDLCPQTWPKVVHSYRVKERK